MSYHDVITFWFDELTYEDWFTVKEQVDYQIRKRFLELHRSAAAGELIDWRTTPEGALAEIIVLDQFSRNLFRGKREAYEHDEEALILAQEAVRRGDDQAVGEAMRPFFYMPYMHSESAYIHEQAVTLFKTVENPEYLKYEMIHKEIIDTFGRYPHRNDVLGRVTTPDEQYYLENEDLPFAESQRAINAEKTEDTYDY